MQDTRELTIDLIACSDPVNRSWQLVPRPPNAEIVALPVTATQSPRYDSSTGSTVRTEFRTIHGGIHISTWTLKSLTTNLGQWKMYINPEGSPYYVTASHPFSIVTDSVIQEADTQEKLNKGIHHVMAQIEDLSFQLPRNVELYIRYEKAAGGCKYYFVDHDAQTEFWLQDVEMSTLGMPEVSSVHHTKHVLQEHYWTHVEFFPYRYIPKHLRVELADLLRHARADQMTSDNSTFPYSAQQCADFIQIIDTNADEVTEYMTCLVARIWVMIARHRYDHFYGEQHARLCRDQGILGKPAAHVNFGMKICSAILFHFPKGLQVELELLYVDNLVYAIHWRTFVAEITKSWRDVVKLDVGMLIINAAFLNFVTGVPSMYPGLASMLLATGGLLSGNILLHNYAKAGKVNAATVAVYLRQIEHKKLGFGPISAAFSIPKAFTLWSILFFVLELLTTISFIPDPINLCVMIVVACLMAVAFIFMAAVLRQASVNFLA